MAWHKIRTLWDTFSRIHSDKTPLSRERGQSLVEFAILLPLLLLIVLGTIDLGMGFKTYIALTNADREGARWITIHPSDEAGARARVAEEAVRVGLTNGVLDQNWYGVSFSPPEGNKYKAGDKVTVTVEYEYKLLFGAITGLPAIHFAANSTMVVLYDE